MLAADMEASRKKDTTSPDPLGAGNADGAVVAAMADGDELDLDTLRRTVLQQQTRDLPTPPHPVIRRVPETTDDFIRNFLVRNNMRGTLEMFETEWYKHGGGAVGSTLLVPDNYLESAALVNRIDRLEHDLRQHAELTTKLTKQWTQAKKDRDFHRASHNRVVQEKNRLERLLRQAHHEVTDVSPALVDLRQRCEALFKAKTLVTLERDKLEQKVGQLEKRIDELEALVAAQNDDGAIDGMARATGTRKQAAPAKKKERKPAGTAGEGALAEAEAAFTWPADERPRAVAAAPGRKTMSSLQRDVDPTSWSCQASFLVHTQAATKLALHPYKPVVATCSDDGGWRLSALPQGEVIVTSADAHANWISSVAFHPTGTLLATGSGDKTVKLWSLAGNACQATLLGHTDGVWAVDFQETGALLASSGLDTTARVWDVEVGKCRQTLRGHVDAVNAVRWQPYTNVVCTGSADKTVSLWDARMNCCSHSLYGHENAVLSVTPPPANSVAAATTPTAGTSGSNNGGAGGQQPLQLLSSDADGVVKLWDLRMMQARLSISVNQGKGSAYSAANHVALDASGRFAAVACDDGAVRVIDLGEGTVTELTDPASGGSQDAVLCVAFDPSTNNFLVSCGADRTVRYWS